MDEIGRFEYENRYGETVTTTAADCITAAEILLIEFDVPADLLCEALGTEVLFSHASSQPEYQHYLIKKTEVLKGVLPNVKKGYINLLTSVLLNTALLKFKGRLLDVEIRESISLDILAMVQGLIELRSVDFSKEKSIKIKFAAENPDEYREGAEFVPRWRVHPPDRIQGYANALIKALEHFEQERFPKRPTARRVLEFLRERVRSDPWAWPEIAQVHAHELAFYDSRGDVATADLDALRKAIDRYTRPT